MFLIDNVQLGGSTESPRLLKALGTCQVMSVSLEGCELNSSQ